MNQSFCTFRSFYRKYFLHIIRTVVLIIGSFFFGGGCPQAPTESENRVNPPSPPSYLWVSSLSETSLSLEWWVNSYETYNTYRIERAEPTKTFQVIGQTSVGAMFYKDQSVTKGKQYQYRVSAVKDTLTGPPSNVITVGFSETVTLIRTVSPQNEVGRILISIDGKYLVSSSTSMSSVSIWDTGTWEERKITENVGNVGALAVTSDAKNLVIGGWNNINVRQLSDGSIVKSFDTQNARPYSLVLTPDGNTMVMADNVGRLRVYQYQTGTILVDLDSAKYGSWQLAASPADDRITACSYLNLNEWETGKRFLRKSIVEHYSSPVYSPQGSFLSVNSTSSPYVTTLFRTSDWNKVYTVNGNSSPTAFSPDETLHLIGDKNYLRMVNTISGSAVNSFAAHTNPITAIAFFQDGRLFATGSRDQTIKIWSLSQTEQWHIIQ